MNHEWTQQAACRGMNPDLFFSERGDHKTLITAMEVCNGTRDTQPCPVKQQCLDQANRYAATDPYGDNHGVWGGMTPSARLDARRKQAKIARRTRIVREPEPIWEPAPAERQHDCARPAAENRGFAVCGTCDGARWNTTARGFLFPCRCDSGLVAV